MAGYEPDEIRALLRQYAPVEAADVAGRGASSVSAGHAAALAFLQGALVACSGEELGGASQRAAAEAEVARRQALLERANHPPLSPWSLPPFRPIVV